MHDNQEITRGEIKQEFQVERMILFSDAVFAIVITLMAIEIKIPETEGTLSAQTLPKALLHLVPVVFAYMVSFLFIGSIWYRHLKIFSLLRDYDKGLVIRNLLLLFFVGLFPFCASLITRAKGQALSFFIYIGIILLCVVSQYILYHYIVIKRPQLQIDTDIKPHLAELRKRRITTFGFVTAAILISITYTLIPDPDLKSLSVMWMVLFGIGYRVMAKKKGIASTND